MTTPAIEEVGALVAIGHGPNTRLGNVLRTTATQIIVRFNTQERRYRRSDLREVGRKSDVWSGSTGLRLATLNDVNEVVWRRVLTRARNLRDGYSLDERRSAAADLRETLEDYLGRTAPQEAPHGD